MILRLVFAVLLGAVVGFERERRDKAAGLRTHVLISTAACLFALLTLGLLSDPIADVDQVRTDPIRLIEAVTAGVAFLAAGTIFTAGNDRVLGLTTGAGMWMAGAIGAACGLGYLGLELLAAGLAIVVLWLFKSVME
ncbi:MgtC/SapB family protein [Pseudooceanicola onchidii]|uniref:MgtC/SapB family protein n=1 Tax=Pseudooceanicola onchidii TaxID=2562279 RepID=UPI0010AAD51F|nr:MgtC/SapB family protein [Pseudooceanicola onchidii]